jgi:CRISPR-associated protein (TIGR02584 family)
MNERVLLCSLGLSPQVLTETLYGIWRMEGAAGMPNKILGLTTRKGAERAALLLCGKQGWLSRFGEEYGVSGLSLQESDLRVIEMDESPLGGLAAGPEESLRAGREVTEYIAELTKEEQGELHVSIAGGRKVAGFYLGQAMILHGRPQDKLSHVLVSEEFESHPEFFYPSREMRVLFSRLDGRPLNAAEAVVELIDIPFVRLRPWLGQNLRRIKGSYGDFVNTVQKKIDSRVLILDTERSRICYANRIIRLSPAEFAFLSMFARRRKLGKGAVSCPSDGAPDRELAHAYWAEYQALGTVARDPGRTKRALADGMTKSFFLERRSRLKEQLERELGWQGGDLAVQAKGRRPDTRYELAARVDAVMFGSLEGEQEGTR